MLAASVGCFYYQRQHRSLRISNLSMGLLHKSIAHCEAINIFYYSNFFGKCHGENLSTIDLLFSRIEADFRQSKDLSPHLLALKVHLEKAKNIEEIELIAKKMNHFLRKKIFSDSIDCLISSVFYRIHPVSIAFPELEKEKLLQLECFFCFMDELINKIQDAKLVEDTKLLFANLPCREKRENFPNLFLSPREQVAILVRALQRQEDALVREILDRLENESIFFTPREEKLLKKLLIREYPKASFSLKAELSETNQEHLRKALAEAQLRRKDKGVKAVLVELFQRCDSWEQEKLSLLPEGPIKLLKRVAKCKFYFMHQMSLPSQEISIPYWYHATKRRALSRIIQLRQVNVYYRKGEDIGYTGAWVSSQVESNLFGRNVIAFTKELEGLDEDVRRSLTFFTKRWRGFMKPLPLTYAILFSVKYEQNKETQKAEKIRLYQELSSSSSVRSSLKIISEKQMVFIQKEIDSILGQPNLSASLWRPAN
jgi:hypothetical protein